LEVILNSKYFEDLTPAKFGESAKSLGYDGVDVCVRPGHPVHPGNVAVALPQAVAVWADQGLSCPLATLPTDFTDPLVPEVEAVYAACAESGVQMIKPGYFGFADGDDYWQTLDRARSHLEGFAALSERHGVKTACHTHSGRCLGSNCAGLMHLVQGFDATHVGAYPDVGHMALDGEDVGMGLAMVRDYLCAVGAKDGVHLHKPGAEPPYEPRYAQLGAGAVDWRRVVHTLAAMNFSGPWAIHTEYGPNAVSPALERIAAEDAAFLRRIAAESAV